MSTPLGVFDPNILCKDCDGYINTHYDDPAFNFMKSFSLSANEYDDEQGLFAKKTPNCNMFCGFILSVLWRSSISKRPEVCTVDFGPYQNTVRDVLWGIKPLSSLTNFEVMCHRYRTKGVKIENMYCYPVRTKFDRFNVYSFFCLGFRIVAKFDRQPFPEYYRPFVLNGNDIFRGFLIDFEETLEARQIRDLIRAATQRRSSRTRQRR